jgi:glycerate kinase
MRDRVRGHELRLALGSAVPLDEAMVTSVDAATGPRDGLRIVIAPDKFRSSLSAGEAATAIAAGIRRACPTAELVLVPIADGGEGTVDAALWSGHQPVTATFALRDASAVIELASASGLSQLPHGVPAPLTASTYGVGELVRAALDAGAREIVLGLGGSASTDGGTGLAVALGARLYDSSGEPLPPGGAALLELDSIDLSGVDPRLAEVALVLATDVDNPLVGPNGAAAVYGPQKGATPEEVTVLDHALRRFAEVVRRDLGHAIEDAPGGGAAGGTGAGGVALLGGRLESGTALVQRVVGFVDALPGADLVITGEGSLDRSSLAGKAPVGVAITARAAGVPVVALVGRLAVTADELAAVGIGQARALLELEPDPVRSQANAAALLTQLAEEVGRRLSP